MNIYNWPFVVVGIYRKSQLQNQEFLKRLDALIEVLVSLKDENNFIVVGDFNIDVLSSTPEASNFKIILESYGFCYVVDFPTRVTLTSETAIGNVLTNLNKSLTKITGIVTVLSDGQVLEVKVPT